jgi:hypothetical protein
MHQGFASRDANYLPAILAGDTDDVAHILRTMHYYTANESDYQAGMRRCKAKIDQTLGPATPPAGPSSASTPVTP